MTILPLLVAAGLSTSAQAGDDGVGIRLKVNSDLFQVRTTEAYYDGEAVENSDTKTTTMGLYNGLPRFEASYIITPNIEAGLIVGYSSTKPEAAGEEGDQTTFSRLGVHAAYNLKLGDCLRGYVQPMLIMGNVTTGKGEDYQSSLKSTMYGADLGLRIRLVKGATFDPGFEFLTGSAKVVDKDGEPVPDDNASTKMSQYGLKAGISVKF